MKRNDSTWTRRDFVARLGGAALGLAVGGVATPGLAGRLAPGSERIGAAVPTAWFGLSLSLVRSAGGFSPPVAATASHRAGASAGP